MLFCGYINLVAPEVGMAELGSEFQKPAQKEQFAAEPLGQAWSDRAQPSWNTLLEQKDVGTVALPTLHVADDRLNVCDVYSVNSDIARLYSKNRPAIVRINTLDPTDNGSFGISAGSGSIIDQSGIIATGYHVVKDATTLRVKTADGTIYAASLLAADPAKDEALLQISTENPFKQFPTVTLAADSSQVTPAEELVGLGFPKNQEAMHVSMLTAGNRLPLSDLKVTGGLLLGEDKDRTLIKTSGAVDSGDSGGPVFDRKTGEQVGIVNLNDHVHGNAYITPIEDLQLFMAVVKAKYDIASLPVQTPGKIDRSFFQQPDEQALYVPGAGLRRLERVLAQGGY